jgi:hypothetical protein
LVKEFCLVYFQSPNSGVDVYPKVSSSLSFCGDTFSSSSANLSVWSKRLQKHLFWKKFVDTNVVRGIADLQIFGGEESHQFFRYL